MFEIDFTINEPFQLESGEILPEVRLRATIYGKLNATRSNAVLVFHAVAAGSTEITPIVWAAAILGTVANSLLAVLFISAAVSLQDRAKREGGNAVINIHSVYKNDKFESPTEYLCGAGSTMAGVALRGTVVTLPK